MDNRVFASCVCVVLVASVPLQAADEFSYNNKNTFMERDNCLGIYPGTSLVPKEKLWRFLAEGFPRFAKPPFIGEVSHTISAAKAKEKFDSPDIVKRPSFERVWNDKPLWAEIGCFHTLDADNQGYETLARIIPESKDSMSIGFAIRGLPAGAWVLQGLGKPVSMAVKDNPYVELVQHLVTDACHAPDSLIYVRKSSILNGREIVQLSIGKVKKVSPEKRKQILEEKTREYQTEHYKKFPAYKKERVDEVERKDYFESAEICQFFLDGRRVLKEEKISRLAGEDRESGYETELDSDSWIDMHDDTLGFISLDEGKNWDVLHLVYGMETVNFMIHSLDSSSVTHYHESIRSFR
jgi:hypothetical protein